jgi:hypothetical protein
MRLEEDGEPGLWIELGGDFEVVLRCSELYGPQVVLFRRGEAYDKNHQFKNVTPETFDAWLESAVTAKAKRARL